MSSNWDEHGFDDKIEKILASVVPSSPGHHLGTPFLTAYQIAIEFNRQHGDIVQKLGYQVGGKGIGEHVSLAQYIARLTSQRIKAGKLPNVEGAFLSRHDLQDITFATGIQSSAEGGWDVSMYRLKAVIA
jgi:hypothetical protein